MKDLYFNGLGGAVKVMLADGPLQMMVKHRQLWPWQVERGGLLFASSVGSEDGLVPISTASPPRHSDRAGRTWLELDHGCCLREIREQFDLGLHFVGYWHTHPEFRPRLSSQDRAALKPLLVDPGIDLVRLVLVVVGGNRQRLGIHVSVLDRPTGAVHELLLDAEASAGRVSSPDAV